MCHTNGPQSVARLYHNAASTSNSSNLDALPSSTRLEAPYRQSPYSSERLHKATADVVKACDSCRQKRTKCSGTRPTCSQCTQIGAGCHYSDAIERPTRHRVEKCVKSSRTRSSWVNAPVRASHSQHLEARIHELEATLRQYQSPQHASAAETSGNVSQQEPDNDSQRPSAASEVSGGRGTIVLENTGEMRYFGVQPTGRKHERRRR